MYDKLANIKLLCLDVDGVLTDGTIEIGADKITRRRYHVRDGIAVQLVQSIGVKVALVSSSNNEGINHRADKLGIKIVRTGATNKKDELKRIANDTNTKLKDAIFMGDDYVDLPAMLIAGISATVADAEQGLLDYADIVTKRKGGHGAVRELCDMIMMAKAPTKLEEIQRCGIYL